MVRKPKGSHWAYKEWALSLLAFMWHFKLLLVFPEHYNFTKVLPLTLCSRNFCSFSNGGLIGIPMRALNPAPPHLHCILFTRTQFKLCPSTKWNYNDTQGWILRTASQFICPSVQSTAGIMCEKSTDIL